ncbi:MAG: hypothetical protein GX649_10800, partial [Chloroflexi bacterium]|nr:hypothetical protein [Chloroflexota bacterium]
MDPLQSRIQHLLERLPKQGLRAARELLAQLNYSYANEPLPLAPFIQREEQWLHGAPRIVAQVGDHGDPFEVIHATLSPEAPQGRGFPLSITAERAIAQRLLQDHPNALFLFSDVEQTHWHLANLRDLSQTGPGGERRLRSALRRIAIGPNERLRTATERIAMLDVGPLAQSSADGVPRAADIRAAHEEAFDVSRVTKAFFDDYLARFDALRGHVSAYLPPAGAHDYAQQYLNRLMFLCFVQRKGWLGGNPQFLSILWREYRRTGQPADTFGSHWLDVLFFEALNNGYVAGRSDRQYLPPTIRTALTMAPYLNGGLFHRNSLDREYADAGGQVPDSLLRNILDLLEAYNFTIAEDTPLDQEVAVDPEMLGHVYESLVNVSDEIDERGEAGIFYTPRVEIDLMCRLAVVRRLTNALGKEHHGRLTEAVFALDPEEQEEADAGLCAHNLWPALNDALEHLTVCDPACGSGSFLVGMLHVLDDLQGRADAQLGRNPRPYERKQRIIERSLYGVDVKAWAVRVAELRLWLYLVVENDAPLEELQTRPLLPSLDFKLRAGDSLVQRVAGVDLAHRTGNSLSPALKGRITSLQKEKNRYFQEAGSGAGRDARRKRIASDTRDLFIAIIQERLSALDQQLRQVQTDLIPRANILGERSVAGNAATLERQRASLQAQRDQAEAALRAVRTDGELPFVWDLDFVEIFSGDAHGFDVVIGNPPYVRQEAIDDPLAPRDVAARALNARKKAYKDDLSDAVEARWPRSFGPGRRMSVGKRSDLYIYFYLVGLDLVREDGAFCFITSNAWLDVDYGSALQEFLLTRGRVHLVIDNQVKRSFASADVNTVIALLGKPVDAAAARAENLDHRARFVMCQAPFEALLHPIPWMEVAAAHEREARPEFRVFPARQRWLLDQGMNPDTQRYAGDKWGGKYLRAPDIYWTIMEKAGDKLVRLGDIAEVRRGITTGANDFFHLEPTGQLAGQGLLHVRN